jgi:hypothetical protein
MHSRISAASPWSTQRPAFRGALRTRRLETRLEWVYWSPIGSPVSNLEFPISGISSAPRRDRFAFRADRFAIASTTLSSPRMTRAVAFELARRPRVWAQANPSWVSWSAQTVGRLRTRRVTVRSAGARPSAMASMMRGER